jgi:hypothetical protein
MRVDVARVSGLSGVLPVMLTSWMGRADASLSGAHESETSVTQQHRELRVNTQKPQNAPVAEVTRLAESPGPELPSPK